MRGFLILSAILPPLSASVSEGRPPNVVILYANDMGFGDVGGYGCDDIATPQIDAHARWGVRFTDYYSAAPLCSPSRAAL
ncbi:MAG: sulfatase-like hydrolase/transferase [Phycisphaerae bacterium]|nr:sulfatase-like hydrolase/transferase [Phycisphaerae bacterium]